MSVAEKHHPFSPSKLKQFKLCPGSFKMSIGEEDVSSPAAQEGTAMHMAVETGKILDEFNQEQQDCIQQELDYIETISITKGGERFMEHKVSVMDGFDILTEGTMDYVYILPDLIIALDHKFGRTPVKASHENNQIKAYSAGLMQKYKRPVEFHIGQPRLHYFEPVRFELSDLPSIIIEIKQIKADCLGQSMILNPGSACTYCLGKEKCPAYNMNLDETVLTKIEHTADLTCDQIGDYLSKATIVEDVIKRLKYRAKEHLIKGDKIAGWGLQNRQGKATVTDAQEAYKLVKDFVSMEDFYKTITVKLTSLVDSYAKNRKETDGVTLKQSKSEIMETLAPFIKRASDSVSLVKKGD